VKLAALAVGLVLGSVAGTMLLGAAYDLRRYGSPYGYLDLQGAGTPAGALKILTSWATPPGARLLDVARSALGWDMVLLVATALVATASLVLLKGPLKRARNTPGRWYWVDRLAVFFDDLAGLVVPAAILAAVLGIVADVLYRSILVDVSASWAIIVAGLLARAKLLLLGFVVFLLTGTVLYVVARNRSPRLKEFIEVVRVTRFSLLAVVAVGAGLCIPDQLRDAFRALAEGSWFRVVLTEVVLLAWGFTVWYAGRFLLNVSFETADVFASEPGFSPASPELTGERHWPRLLGVAAFLVFALATFLAWWEVADFTDEAYPRLVLLSGVNVVLSGAFWLFTRLRHTLMEQLTARRVVSPRGLVYRDMPSSVQWLVCGSVAVVLVLWLVVFFFPQSLGPGLGTVFANLVDTTDGGGDWRGGHASFAGVPDPECPYPRHAPGKYQALAARLLAYDFLAPTTASMLYGDFLARLLPFSLLTDRAEAMEISWERAWDAAKRAPPAGLTSTLWDGNPFTRSFDDLYAGERIDPAALRGRHVPLIALNGTIVESGTRILVSHLDHPARFKGDLENAFDHRNAPMRMSTAALMSARFTYVSPEGTLAPGTHVVDGGYFENSGVVTALQWWAEIEDAVNAVNDAQPKPRILAFFIYIDNSPPDPGGTHASLRGPAPARMELRRRSPRLLPELSAPISALLGAREAHAVQAKARANRWFGDDFVSFDTNIIGKAGTRLEKAPMGWVLSRTTQKILDRELCRNDPAVARVMELLP
jgi:hypothetical protein